MELIHRTFHRRARPFAPIGIRHPTRREQLPPYERGFPSRFEDRRIRPSGNGSRAHRHRSRRLRRVHPRGTRRATRRRVRNDGNHGRGTMGVERVLCQGVPKRVLQRCLPQGGSLRRLTSSSGPMTRRTRRTRRDGSGSGDVQRHDPPPLPRANLCPFNTHRRVTPTRPRQRVSRRRGLVRRKPRP